MSAAVAPSRAAASTSRSRSVSGLAPSAIAAAASAGSITRPPGEHHPHRVGELRRRRVLDQEAGGARLDGPAQVAGAAEGGEDQRPRSGSSRASAAAASRPSRPGISMSSSATSGRCARAGCERLVAPAGLGHDLDVVLQREQAGERAAHHRLVLGDQDADHGARQRDARGASRNAAAGPGAGLQRAADPARALREAGEAVAAVRVAGAGGPSSSTSSATPSGGGERDRAGARAAVAHDVRGRLAHGPGQQALDLGRQPSGASPRRGSRCPAAASAVRAPSSSSASASRAVAADRLAHLGQRLPGRPAATSVELRRAPGAGSRRRSFAASSLLSAISGERVAEQVVEVAGDAQPLLLDGEPGELLACGAQLAVRLGLAAERGHQQADGEDREHVGRDRGVVRAAHREAGAHPGRGDGDDRARGGGGAAAPRPRRRRRRTAARTRRGRRARA